MTQVDPEPAAAPSATATELQRDIERGLQFANVMLAVTQDQSSESMTYVQALADLLLAKGVITTDELEATVEQAREDLAKVIMPKVRLADLGDKYADTTSVDIDCASRLHLCHARCCTFRFYLTKQDLDEGVARWDYGNPYWIRQSADGYCAHCDPTTRHCGIHAQRPHVCRRYDCRHDARIWLDFAGRVPAPMDLAGPDRPMPVAMLELATKQPGRADEPASAGPTN